MDQNETKVQKEARLDAFERDLIPVKAHPFARTLGPGPYKYVGFFDLGRVIAALHAGNVNGYNNGLAMAPKVEAGMGTCAHCGHAILNIFVIETGEKRRFGIGSDCILKVGIEAKELTKVQKAVRNHAKELRDARKAKKEESARFELATLLETHILTLNALPHPSIDGLTLYQYVTWILQRPSNKVFALKRVQTILSKNETKESVCKS
jgi:hypothetical protein